MLRQPISFYRASLLVEPDHTGWAQIKYAFGGSVEGARVKKHHD